MTPCGTGRETLMAHADGQLDAAVAERLEAHVAVCADCRAALAAERALSAFLRRRLAPQPAPAALRARIGAALGRAAAPSPWYARLLGSPWTPRLAMAAVLAVLVFVPSQSLLRRTPAIAMAAAERHTCHGLVPGGGLPPCCTELSLALGDALGPPSEGVLVPDLRPAGLALARTTRCVFRDEEVNFLAYRDAGGGSFSLYISGRSLRGFKQLRTQERHGVAQAWYDVPGPEPGPGDGIQVVLWQRGSFVYTCVGPAGVLRTAVDALLSRDS